MKHVKLFEQFLNEAKYIKLSSVGSIIDQDGIVYPEKLNGKPDLQAGTPISEVDDSWKEGLSDEDKKIVAKFESIETLEEARGRKKGGAPEMYIRYMGAVKQLRELEDYQKELAEPYFKAREEGNHTAMVKQMELLKAGQAKLDAARKNISKMEKKYINTMDYFVDPKSETAHGSDYSGFGLDGAWY